MSLFLAKTGPNESYSISGNIMTEYSNIINSYIDYKSSPLCILSNLHFDLPLFTGCLGSTENLELEY